MSVYPYFMTSLPELNFDTDGNCPSVESLCEEAKEILSEKDLRLLCYIFAPNYHIYWINKIKDKAVKHSFIPLCLVEEIEKLPYIHEFTKEWNLKKIFATDPGSLSAEQEDFFSYVAVLKQENLEKIDGILLDGQDWDYTKDLDCISRLEQLFYKEITSQRSPFLKQYYSFEWEWKMITSFLNSKKYHRAALGGKIPFYKNDPSFVQWVNNSRQDQYSELKFIWDFTEDFIRIYEEEDILKREKLCDGLRFDYAKHWAGDFTVASDCLWSFFVCLQIQHRWVSLKALNGKEQLKEKVKSLRSIDWQAMEEGK